MEIKVKNEKGLVLFDINEDTNIHGYMDMIVNALLAESFAAKTIIEGLKGKAEAMELEKE